LCANTDGSHQLKYAVVGKSRWPYVLKVIMNYLQVLYCNYTKAWYTYKAPMNGFIYHSDPEVRQFHTAVLSIRSTDVSALKLPDNVLSHLKIKTLSSCDIKIKCQTFLTVQL